jgi:hypothetical protein
LQDLCEMFSRFLRGCGYCLDGGEIEFVPEMEVVNEDINQSK